MNNPNRRPSGRRPLTPFPTFLRVPRASVRCFPSIFHFSFFIFLLLASCKVEPGPLYGSWADNKGNTLSFFDDNTFNAKITAAAGLPPVNYSGNYSLLLNSLTMSCTEVELRVVTEWDIRGNILYLNWVTPDGDTLPLTLFKVSN